jgi:hypothetical protein
LRIAHADEELARDVKDVEGVMRKRASDVGSGHAHPSRRRRDGGTSWTNAKCGRRRDVCASSGVERASAECIYSMGNDRVDGRVTRTTT